MYSSAGNPKVDQGNTQIPRFRGQYAALDFSVITLHEAPPPAQIDALRPTGHVTGATRVRQQRIATTIERDGDISRIGEHVSIPETSRINRL